MGECGSGRTVMKRKFAVVAFTLLLVFQTQSAPAASDRVVVDKPDPVDVSNLAVPLASDAAAKAAAPQIDEAEGDLVAELKPRATGDYAMVGVTWKTTPGLGEVTVDVRTRKSSRWSTWKTLEVDGDQGEGGGRPGTEPLWVDEADGVSVRIQTTSGVKPADIKVTTIDPGEAPAAQPASAATPAVYDPLADTSSTIQTADGSPTYTARPSIVTRSRWGASAGGRCDSPTVGETTKGAVLHHTAGSNSYSRGQAAGIVRATQAYHIKGRKWCDIGYNFLVDIYGRIYEGRKGGMDRAVRAAHSGNGAVNTYTMGVSMMGNFDRANVGHAMRNSLVKLIGWRMGTTFLPATGTYSIGGKTLHRIAGHRNVVGTACPGKHGYAWLTARGGLRDRVKAYIADYRSSVKSYAASLGAARTGPVYIGEWGNSTKRKAIFKRVDILWEASAGVHYVGAFFRTEYNRLKSHGGVLGFPTTGQSSTSHPTIAVQRFQNGAIYRVKTVSSYMAHGLWGSVGRKYVEEGEAGGRLGYPTRHLYKDSAGAWVAEFRNGTIRYTLATGAVVILK